MNDQMYNLVLAVVTGAVPILVGWAISVFAARTNIVVSDDRKRKLEALLVRALKYALNKYAGRDPEFQIDVALNYAERGAPELLNKLEKDVDARANVLRDRLEGLRPEVQAAIDAIKSGVY